MTWLNYHHLLYFWTVARLGSVRAASEELNLSQPALSTQIRQLEAALEERLFEKQGRGLRLTEAGRMAYRYADEIFTLGREFQNELKGRPTGRPLQLVVGASDVLSKLMVHRLLQPALRLEEPLRLSCREGGLAELIRALLDHEVDLVLSDAPCPPRTAPRAFNHLLGVSGMDLFAAPDLLAKHPGGFPGALDGAPVLLPALGSALRRDLDTWFERHGLHPIVAGEFEDSALLKTFGAEGEGFFAAPAALAEEVCRHYRVQRVCGLEGIQERVYAISAARRLVHPAVVAILRHAKEAVFPS